MTRLVFWFGFCAVVVSVVVALIEADDYVSDEVRPYYEECLHRLKQRGIHPEGNRWPDEMHGCVWRVKAREEKRKRLLERMDELGVER